MIYLLDTNTCIQYLRGKSPEIIRSIVTRQASDICLCSVVRGELQYGALRSSDPSRNQQLVEYFCRRFTSLPFNDEAADVYAAVRSHLASIGQIIGPNDLMIAAIALTNDVTLVTHNTREFSRVPGIKLDDWEK